MQLVLLMFQQSQSRSLLSRHLDRFNNHGKDGVPGPSPGGGSSDNTSSAGILRSFFVALSGNTYGKVCPFKVRPYDASYRLPTTHSHNSLQQAQKLHKVCFLTKLMYSCN